VIVGYRYLDAEDIPFWTLRGNRRQEAAWKTVFEDKIDLMALHMVLRKDERDFHRYRISGGSFRLR
jgi:hypothetical protein